MHMLILDTLTDALICPAAFFYIFLLSDAWRISRIAQTTYTVLSGVAFILLTLAFPSMLAVCRVFTVWLVFLFPIPFFCHERDARLLFIILTGLVFTCMNTSVGFMASYWIEVHPVFVCLFLDSIGVLFCYLFLVPLFRRFYHSVREGWLISSLLPLSICTVYLALWNQWRAPPMLIASQLHSFFLIIGIFTPITYLTLFHFITEQQQRSEAMINHSFFGFQFNTLVWLMKRREANELSGRILRHDLRHYIPMLHACLEQNDKAGAKAIIASMQALLRQSAQDEHTATFTGEPMVDIVLSYFSKHAENQGVSMHIDLVFPPELPLDFFVICGFLAASLDDALLGCAQLEGDTPRCIELFAYGEGAQFEMRTASTYQGAVMLDAATQYPRMKDVESSFPSSAVMMYLHSGGAKLHLRPREGWFDLCMTARKGEKRI